MLITPALFAVIMYIAVNAEKCTIQSIRDPDQTCPRYVYLDLGESGIKLSLE